FDEFAFDRGLRLEFVLEVEEELAESLLGFAAEDDGSGEKAVFYGVAGGSVFAFRSDRAAGFCAVGAGSLILTFSSHFDSRMHGRGRDFGDLERVGLILKQMFAKKGVNGQRFPAGFKLLHRCRGRAPTGGMSGVAGVCALQCAGTVCASR